MHYIDSVVKFTGVYIIDWIECSGTYLNYLIFKIRTWYRNCI